MNLPAHHKCDKKKIEPIIRANNSETDTNRDGVKRGRAVVEVAGGSGRALGPLDPFNSTEIGCEVMVKYKRSLASSGVQYKQEP